MGLDNVGDHVVESNLVELNKEINSEGENIVLEKGTWKNTNMREKPL